MLNNKIILGLIGLCALAVPTAAMASTETPFELRPAFDLGAHWMGAAAASDAAAAVAAPLEASLPVMAVRLPRAAGRLETENYGVFGSVALPVSSLPAMAQWRSVSSRDFTTQFGAHCTTAACSSGVDALLTKAAQKAEGQPALEALSLINSSVNTLIRYRPDAVDHWAPPTETAAKGTGDCEDYAIAKLWLLRSIGYTAAQLQLVVLKDTRTGEYHAVLAVHAEGQNFILDNMSSRVLPDTVLRNYVPIESFSGQQAYVHGFAKAPSPTITASLQPAE